METIAPTLREKDAEKLIEFVTNGKIIKSWLVQGMPGGGVDLVFKDIAQRMENISANQEKIKVINIDFASLWTSPLSASLFQYFIKPLPFSPLPSTEKQTNNTISLLELLRTTIKDLAEEGWQFVYIFNHFDSILKFANLEEIQLLLNTFQSLCYENVYKTSNIVEIHRDIEDICRHTNYSDYYKVFGTNHTRVSRYPKSTLEQEIKKCHPKLREKNIKRIIHLCGGYPEIADVILRGINIESQDAIEEDGTTNQFSISFPFDRWVECLSPEELLVLEKIGAKNTIEKELLFSQRKLLRKELLVENQEKEIFFASPLFENFLTARVPIKNSTNRVLIKRRGLINSLHRELIEALFNDRFIIELKLQQEPLPGDAYVYLVTGEDEKGVTHRPCIVKIDESDRSEQENKNLETARQMLGTMVPSVLKRNSLRGQEAVILEYATADNKNYSVQQFAEFYQKQKATEISDLLKKTFGNALVPLYRTQKVTEKDAKKMYFLPRRHHGEYDTLSEIARKSSYFHEGELVINGIAKKLKNPGEYLKPPHESSTPSDSVYGKLFLSKLPVGISMAHGDLNPRNLLIDGIGNIHIIDFSELKQEGARFLDFARLEAEIKFKLANFDRNSLEMFIALESMMTNIHDTSQLETISKLPLETEAQKLALAIYTLRHTAFMLHIEGGANHNFILEYFLCLLTQTLRISLFQDYTTDLQKEYAVISAALLIEKIEKII